MQQCVDDLADDVEVDALSFESSSTGTDVKPRTAPSGDPRRDAIRHGHGQSLAAAAFAIGDLRFLRRLGSGDIGSVYLAELKCASGCLFAAKVMDKEELASRNKEGRARVEREILELLDHPFLPTLYATVDSPRWSCLLTEFCPGGDLHVLRQRQSLKRFDEAAVRFYASEVVAALEYLHMMGIVYRDLKSENVLVRSDGHIMLTDFDLSLRCHTSASTTSTGYNLLGDHAAFANSSCILPNCVVPAVSCFQYPRSKHRRRRRDRLFCGGGMVEIVAEPVEARSMSFVGTHEYLAPEIVAGEGHGNAVDWWTLGVFMFELWYGVTPFKGRDNELTLANIMARALEFPKEPTVTTLAKDLMTQLMAKDPTKRLGSTIGATAIKRHPFFAGVNWALLRCTTPPFLPGVADFDIDASSVEYY